MKKNILPPDIYFSRGFQGLTKIEKAKVMREYELKNMNKKQKLKFFEKEARAKRAEQQRIKRIVNKKMILLMRKKGYTLAKIGDKLGMTRERVRQIEGQLGLVPRNKLKK